MKRNIRPSIDHGLLSPSGRVSKRAAKAAHERMVAELFAPWGGHMPRPDMPIQPTEAEYLRKQAAELLALAERGMKPRAYRKRAAELILQAEQEEQGE